MAKDTDNELAAALAENKSLKTRLAELEAADQARRAAEQPILEKVALGLTPAQAAQVVADQRQHDEHMAKLAKAK